MSITDIFSYARMIQLIGLIDAIKKLHYFFFSLFKIIANDISALHDTKNLLRSNEAKINQQVDYYHHHHRRLLRHSIIK